MSAEYPDLLPGIRASLAMATTDRAGTPFWTNEDRRVIASFLRGALQHIQHFTVEGLADNLHLPPPPPPTLAEAREAARQLGGENAAVVHRFLQSLHEGVIE